MTNATTCSVSLLVRAALGETRAAPILGMLLLPPGLDPVGTGRASRAEVALALAAMLLGDVLERVPMGRAYARDVVRAGGRLVFDHGALRTVDGPTGALPVGERAITRVLEPLGFRCAETYPLDRLRMTGRAWRHLDLPEGIPQFFVSELHVDRFSPEFQAAAERVVGESRDPLTEAARRSLAELADRGELPLAVVPALLRDLMACFGRHHDEPYLADYERLLEESAEMAWIATEGHSFNHATDRVEDVRAVAALQARLGRPIKDEIEVSASGRVLQTAFRAAPVERLFVGDDGHLVLRAVPGSFHEFISREALPGGGRGLDLAFDAANAQGIFSMTRGGAA